MVETIGFPVTANQSSAGDYLPIDSDTLAGCTVTNSSAYAVEYSTGGAWTTIAAGGSATINTGAIATTSLRFRKKTGDSIPVVLSVAVTHPGTTPAQLATDAGGNYYLNKGDARNVFLASTSGSPGRLLTNWSDGVITFTGTVSDEAYLIDASEKFNGVSMLKCIMPSAGDGDGIYSLKNTLTSSVSACTIKNLSVPIKFTSNRTSDSTGVTELRILVYFSTGFASFQFYISGQQMGKTAVYSLSSAAVSSYGGGATSASWNSSDVVAVGVQIVTTFAAGHMSNPYWIGPVYINQYDRSRFILTLDKASVSQLNYAKPILDAYRIKPTVAVSVGLIGTGGYLSLSQLQSLYNSGWEMILHSYTDTTNGYGAAAYTDATAVAAAITSGFNWLSSNGMPSGVGHIVIPIANAFESTFTQSQQQKVIDGFVAAGVKTARTGVDYSGRGMAMNTAFGASYIPALSMPCVATLNSTTVASTVTGYLDRAEASCETAILLAHDLVLDSATPTGNQIKISDFETIISAVAAKRDKGTMSVVKMSEFYAELI